MVNGGSCEDGVSGDVLERLMMNIISSLTVNDHFLGPRSMVGDW